MGKFIIQPHGRLQEWIADEKGLFSRRGAGLRVRSRPVGRHAQSLLTRPGKVTDLMSGAFESYKHAGGNKGVKSDISCACHWAVNQASAQQVGTMWGKSYVVTPGETWATQMAKLLSRNHLAGQEIAVGYHSGSHFTTILVA